MKSTLQLIMIRLSHTVFSHLKSRPRLRWIQYAIFATLPSYYLYYTYKPSCSLLPPSIPYTPLPPRPLEPFLIRLCKYIWRFCRLLIIFLPSTLLLPLLLFNRTTDIWLSIFLSAVQKAGIVWVKAFQYLSHRRDIIGAEMAHKFAVLRDHSARHTTAETKKIFLRMYGKPAEEVFSDFESEPFASGSVAQVHRATVRGEKVAVKVRHPEVAANLERDIELLFFFSKMLSYISKRLQVPVTIDSLKNILKEQIYLLKERDNLDSFRSLPLSECLHFPKTYPESRDEVLVEEYIEGESIDYYQRNEHFLNRVIAMNGAKTFFEMLMKHNLIHADCHAGNILVRIKEDGDYWGSKWRNLKHNVMNYAIAKVVEHGFKSAFLRRLAQENYQYQQEIQAIVEKNKKHIQIVLIDVGMTISLSAEKKKSFQQFLGEIIKGDPVQCALWIHRISEQRGAQLKDHQFSEYLRDLEVMFERVHQTALASLEGIVVLNQMLKVIRQHNMKIDGQISILLTNMLVLEAIAKDIDPNINILRCAVPYLRFQ